MLSSSLTNFLLCMWQNSQPANCILPFLCSTARHGSKSWNCCKPNSSTPYVAWKNKTKPAVSWNYAQMSKAVVPSFCKVCSFNNHFAGYKVSTDKCNFIPLMHVHFHRQWCHVAFTAAAKPSNLSKGTSQPSHGQPPLRYFFAHWQAPADTHLLECRQQSP